MAEEPYWNGNHQPAYGRDGNWISYCEEESSRLAPLVVCGGLELDRMEIGE